MGRRFGGPKALADTGDGPWVLRALRTLDALDERVVVVGAAADEVTALLPDGVRGARNPDFSSGMGSSLVAGLRALEARSDGDVGCPAAQITVPVDAAVIMLVDLPDVPAAAVHRVVAEVLRGAERRAHESAGQSAAHAPSEGAFEAAQHDGDVIHVFRNSLARATYRGIQGHPVLIGADHFVGVIEAATGDHGARDYLAGRSVQAIECGDLAGGGDVDQWPGEA